MERTVSMERLLEISVEEAVGGVAGWSGRAEARGCRQVVVAGADDELLRLEASASGFSLAAEANRRPAGGVSVESFVEGHLAEAGGDGRSAAHQRLVRLVELAGRWGATRLSVAPAVVADGHPRRVDYQEALNRTAAALGAAERVAQREGVTICVRASRHGFLTSPPELRELLIRVNSPAVGVDLDAAGRCDRLALGDWLRTLGPHLRMVGVEEAALARGTPEVPEAGLGGVVLVIRRRSALGEM